MIKFIPRVTPENRKRYENILAIFLGVIVFAGIAYLFSSLYANKKSVSVVAITRPVQRFAFLSQDDLKTIMLPAASVPANSYTTFEQIIGLKISHKMDVNAVVTKNDLYEFKFDSSSDALNLPKGTVGMFLPFEWLYGLAPQIKKNDVIEVFGTVPGVARANYGTTPLVKEAIVSKVTDDGVLLVLIEEGVANITQAKANNMLLSVVLHSVEDYIPVAEEEKK